MLTGQCQIQIVYFLECHNLNHVLISSGDTLAPTSRCSSSSFSFSISAIGKHSKVDLHSPNDAADTEFSIVCADMCDKVGGHWGDEFSDEIHEIEIRYVSM